MYFYFCFQITFSLTEFVECEKHSNQRLNKIAENEWSWWRTLWLIHHRLKEANFCVVSGALHLLICFHVATSMHSSCFTIGSCLNWEFYRYIYDTKDLHKIFIEKYTAVWIFGLLVVVFLQLTIPGWHSFSVLSLPTGHLILGSLALQSSFLQ